MGNGYLARLEEAQIQEYEEKDYETASFLDVIAVFEQRFFNGKTEKSDRFFTVPVNQQTTSAAQQLLSQDYGFSFTRINAGPTAAPRFKTIA